MDDVRVEVSSPTEILRRLESFRDAMPDRYIYIYILYTYIYIICIYIYVYAYMYIYICIYMYNIWSLLEMPCLTGIVKIGTC
jgi:hypothetical protein